MKDNKTKHTKIYDGSNENWIVEPIGKVCEFEKGKKPKNTGPHSDTRTVSYINIKAFETGTPEEYAEAGNYPACSKDDVLIVWDGARAGLIGRGVAGYIGSTLSKVWSEATDNKYLFYFLKSQYNYINTNTKGVGIPHVDPNILYAIELPIVPKKIQKLIVSEIEKQFSRLDEAVAALKRIKANLKRYKASVLKAAVEGKLTEEWRLSQIAKSRLKNEKINDTADLPEGWRCAKLAEIAEINPKLPKNIPDNVEVSFLPMKVVQEETGVIDLSITKKFGEVKKGYTSFINNDIIFAKITPCMENGKIAIVENLKNGLGFGSTEFHVIRLHEPKSKKYLFYFLLQRNIRKQAQRNMTGTAGQLRVPAKFMQEISVSLPPISEQLKIVEEIESCLSVAEEIETAVETNLKRAERLRQAILKKAFSGRLVQRYSS